MAATAAYAAKTTAPPITAAPPAPAAPRRRVIAPATVWPACKARLTDAVWQGCGADGAVERFTANQPRRRHPDRARRLRRYPDAAKRRRTASSDAAASVNLTALLSGDGFSVTPDETQSATPDRRSAHGVPSGPSPLKPGAKGPLHADIGADLLGGGSDTLALGSVQKSAGMGIKLTPKVIGASLLVLIAALVVAWLARGRGPTRSASARRASRRAARGGRPLDMSAPIDDTSAAP